ncbi:hypothetical protein ACN47E_000907 [Coniothyrium glycines]
MPALETALEIVPYAQWVIITSLLVISGIAWSFTFWVVPIIKLNQSNSAIAQLEETSRRGGAWLEPINASFAFLLGFIAILISRHPDPAEAAQWRYFAISCITLLQVAWWERVMIFPLEAKIVALRKNAGKSESAGGSRMDDTERNALHGLLDAWSRWHVVRATLPLIASLVALSTKM